MIKNRRKGQVSIPQSITDAKAKQEEIALLGNKELIKGDIYKGKKRVIQDLKSKSTDTEEFSLMKRLCFKNFDSMVLNLLEMELERDLLLETYNELNS